MPFDTEPFDTAVPPHPAAPSRGEPIRPAAADRWASAPPPLTPPALPSMATAAVPPPLPPLTPAVAAGEPPDSGRAATSDIALAPLAVTEVSSLAPPAAKRTSRLATAAWSLLGLVAAGYLGVAAARPELLADFSALAGARTASRPAPVVTAARDEEVQSLRDTVGRLQAEVTRLTGNVIASEERAAQLSQKLAALDGKDAGAQQTVATAAAAKAAPSAAEAIAGKFDKPAAAEVAAATPAGAPVAEPAAARSVKVINQTGGHTDTSRIETGSISPPPAGAAAAPKSAEVKPPAPAADAATISFGAPVVTKAPRTLGVQIANGPSVDALRLSWSLLAERNADSLKSLHPRYTTGTPVEGSDSFDLVAGPIKSEAQARKVCKTLAARGVPCQVTDYEGNAL